jgi:hypothetical protein
MLRGAPCQVKIHAIHFPHFHARGSDPYVRSQSAMAHTDAAPADDLFGALASA